MKNAICLDIGGTNLRCALINENYEVEKVLIKQTQVGSREVFLSEIENIIKEILPNENTVGIAMGVPGPVDFKGYVSELPNVGIKDLPLAEYINSKLHLPTIVLNDAQVAALGEGCIGAGKGYKSTFFITISTGVGGALVKDGKIVIPDDEIGHTNIKYKNKYYEFEKLNSGNGLLNLCKLNKLNVKNAQEFFLLKSQNNKNALKVYKLWLNNLTYLIQFIKKYFQVDVIVISGGVIKSQEYFFEDLKNMNSNVKLFLAKFRQQAGLIGAAYACFNYIK